MNLFYLMCHQHNWGVLKTYICDYFTKALVNRILNSHNIASAISTSCSRTSRVFYGRKMTTIYTAASIAPGMSIWGANEILLTIGEEFWSVLNNRCRNFLFWNLLSPLDLSVDISCFVYFSSFIWEFRQRFKSQLWNNECFGWKPAETWSFYSYLQNGLHWKIAPENVADGLLPFQSLPFYYLSGD